MSRFESILVVLVAAVGLCVPLYHVDWPATHENASYVVRVVEWVSELRAGHLLPGWAPDFYGGYGSPFFFFHGPLGWELTTLDGPSGAELEQDGHGYVRLSFPHRGVYHVRVARGASTMGLVGGTLSAFFALGLVLLLGSRRTFGSPQPHERSAPLDPQTKPA
jgi:hypothetical protein